MKKNIALELGAGRTTPVPLRLRNGFIKYTPLISSFLLAALFLYAAYNKLAVYKTFISQLKGSPAIKDTQTLFHWLTLISVSVIAGLVIYKPARIAALWAAFSMMVAYTLYNYIIAPGGYENFLAWFIPSLEIAIAATLLIPRTRVAGLWAAFGLMLVFSIYVYVLAHFYRFPGCSCGGIISQLNWKQHFYFNVGFTLLGGLALSLLPTPKTKLPD
jgi:hypothetical protein